jgi:dolichyl-phosphate-mannose-protein mannosyltransferase
MDTETPPSQSAEAAGGARTAGGDRRFEPDDVGIRAVRSERWFRRERLRNVVLMLVGVTVIAAGVRFYHLSRPGSYVFDEVYYAKDGCFDAGIPYRECELDGPREQTVGVHPPLGREMMALAIDAYGNRAFGWRLAPAIAGTVSVTLLALLAYVVLDSLLWGGVAGLLLATENLNFVQSRMAMLDIFIATFVVAGFLFVVLDRRWIERRSPEPERLTPVEQEEAELLDLPPDRPPSPIFRPWRIAAGLAFGAAAATKWSGAPALVGAIVLMLGWERSRRARVGLRRPLWEAFRSEAFGIFLFLVILPLGVYFASYTRWFVEHHWNLGEWFELHRSMAEFSLGLAAEHPYASRPWSWPLLVRPVAYYYVGDKPPGTVAHILGMGNPAVFWGGSLAVLYAAYRWAMVLGWRRLLAVFGWSVAAVAGAAGLTAGIRSLGPELAFLDGREIDLAAFLFGMTFLYVAALSEEEFDWVPAFIVVAFASQYLPWFGTGRTSFLFYMTPITPFMVLAVTYGLAQLAEARVGLSQTRAFAPVAAVAVLICVVLFAFFFPILTGRTISREQWEIRIWFNEAYTAPWHWV